MPADHRSTSARPAAVRAPAPGFTLVEVLVALFVMSLLAVLSWQGVDAMVRTRDASQRRLEATLRLGTVLSQWQQDLASLQETAAVPALRCDGASLQLTRRTPDGMQLVVWSLRSGRWLRWAAPPVATRRELQEHWLRSQQLLGNEPSQLRLLDGVESWQLYFFQGNAWSNCQSTGNFSAAVPAALPVPPPAAPPPTTAPGTPPPTPTPAAPTAPRSVLPNGVRLVLAFAPASGFAGSLTRDMLLAPQP